MKGAKLQLVRRFRAAPDKVFAACTDPAVMQRWFGPKEFRVTTLTADVRSSSSPRLTAPSGSTSKAGGKIQKGQVAFLSELHQKFGG